MAELSFERQAMRDEEAPSGLTLAERKAYYLLRILYREYRAGEISREQASREKKMIVRDMESEKQIDKLNRRIAQLWKEIEIPAREYVHDSTTENADKFYAAVYGLPENWRKI